MSDSDPPIQIVNLRERLPLNKSMSFINCYQTDEEMVGIGRHVKRKESRERRIYSTFLNINFTYVWRIRMYMAWRWKKKLDVLFIFCLVYQGETNYEINLILFFDIHIWYSHFFSFTTLVEGRPPSMPLPHWCTFFFLLPNRGKRPLTSHVCLSVLTKYTIKVVSTMKWRLIYAFNFLMIR